MLNNNYLLSEDVIMRNEDFVLFHTRKNIILECNEMAFDIIFSLSKGLKLKNILEQLYKEYDAENYEIDSAVIEFLGQCIEDEIIEIIIEECK